MLGKFTLNELQYALNIVCYIGHYSIVELILSNNNNLLVEEALFESLLQKNYDIAQFLISKGANMNTQEYKKLTLIENSFKSSNLYFFFYILFIGVSFDSQMQQNCLRMIEKVENYQYYETLIADYNKETLWNVKRNKFFPIFFQKTLFSILISFLVFSKEILKKRIPKPLQYLTIQLFVSQQIKFNQMKQI